MCFGDEFTVLIVEVHILDEFIVVHLVEVAIIHILPQQQVHILGRLREDTKLIQDPQKLVFGDIAYLSDVEVLEMGFKEYPLTGDLPLVLLQ